MSPARWEPPDMGTPGIALQKRHVEENIEKRKNLCLENFGMPDEENATVLKMSA